MSCPFCAIVRGEEEAAVVLASEVAVVFLDRRPLFHGHCLVVPPQHVETLPDLPPSLIGPFFGLVQSLSLAVREATNAEGTFVAMNNKVSQSVPHLHVHVVPRRKGDGLRGFFWPRTKYDGGLSEMREVASRIASALQDVRAGETSL